MTTSDIRKQCARHTSREPCWICGEHEDITQAHHVMPLSECKRFLEQGHTMDEPPVVWLCPNCHVRVHRYPEMPHSAPRWYMEKIAEVYWTGQEYLSAQLQKWIGEHEAHE